MKAEYSSWSPASHGQGEGSLVFLPLEAVVAADAGALARTLLPWIYKFLVVFTRFAGWVEGAVYRFSRSDCGLGLPFLLLGLDSLLLYSVGLSRCLPS